VEPVLYAAAADERVAIRLNTPDPEVVVITSVMPRLSLRLKSTHLSLLGGSPVLVSHLPTCAGGEAIQREATGMVGRSFEHCCLLDHLAELQHSIERLTDGPAPVTLADDALEQLPVYD